MLDKAIEIPTAKAAAPSLNDMEPSVIGSDGRYGCSYRWHDTRAAAGLSVKYLTDGSRFIDSLVVSYAATLAALMLIGAVVAKVF